MKRAGLTGASASHLSRSILLFVAVGLLVLGCQGGLDREAYVARNEALLRSLPVYPGAVEIRQTSTADRADENGPVVGYTTTAVFRLPRGATGRGVADFYEEELASEWIVVDRLDGPVRSFRRDTALVVVNVEGWRGGTLEIGVDYNDEPD